MGLDSLASVCTLFVLWLYLGPACFEIIIRLYKYFFKKYFIYTIYVHLLHLFNQLCKRQCSVWNYKIIKIS